MPVLCMTINIEERSERAGICMTVYSYSQAVSVEDNNICLQSNANLLVAIDLLTN